MLLYPLGVGGVGDLNSDLGVYMTSALRTESSSQALVIICLEQEEMSIGLCKTR